MEVAGAGAASIAPAQGVQNPDEYFRQELRVALGPALPVDEIAASVAAKANRPVVVAHKTLGVTDSGRDANHHKYCPKSSIHEQVTLKLTTGSSIFRSVRH